VADTRFLSVHIPYRVFPIRKPIPGLPGVTETWLPVLKAAIIIGVATSKRFEAIVDSGSAICLFHAQIATTLGLELKAGERGALRWSNRRFRWRSLLPRNQTEGHVGRHPNHGRIP
jgi:hypothetical protein